MAEVDTEVDTVQLRMLKADYNEMTLQLRQTLFQF